MAHARWGRRTFISASALGLAATACGAEAGGEPQSGTRREMPAPGKFPVRAIASANGQAATQLAFQMIQDEKDPIEGVVAGVGLVEADPNDHSVGYGGLPNEQGVVELDAAVMHGPSHRAGSVAALQTIKHPAKVALEVLRRTDHELLVGAGALQFARACGFPSEELLTDKARRIWLHWKAASSDKDDWLTPDESVDPDVSEFFRQHSQELQVAGQWRVRFCRPTGTIHCAAMNRQGDISCTTTTSGLAFKIPGRVGDSPIIGAGLYVDNQIGSCGSTGRGEANLQNLCSFAAVELMRQGLTPQEAGLEVCRRVARHTRRPDLLDNQGRPNFGLKFYLLDKTGAYAGVSLYGPSKFAVTDAAGTRLEDCGYLYEGQLS